MYSSIDIPGGMFFRFIISNPQSNVSRCSSLAFFLSTIFHFIVEKVGTAPTPMDFQSTAMTSSATFPYVGVNGFEPIVFLMCQIYSLVPIHHLSRTPIIY